MVSLVGILVGIMLGLLLGRVLRPGMPRHADPQLHSGPWVLRGQEGREMVWVRSWSAYIGGTAPEGQHPHVPHECRIGYGLSHVDTCACGAVRYGVYGEWEGGR